MDEMHVEEYVRERLRRGDSIESIREMVKVSGYDPAVVDKIISEPAGVKGLVNGLPKVAPNLKAVPRKRPMWITIYGVFSIIAGFFSLAVAVFAFYLGDFFSSKVPSIADFGLVMGIIFLVKGVLGIAGGIGLLKMSRWGYNALLVFLALDILTNLNSSSGQQLIDVVIAYYLYKNRAFFH